MDRLLNKKVNILGVSEIEARRTNRQNSDFLRDLGSSSICVVILVKAFYLHKGSLYLGVHISTGKLNAVG